MPPAVHIENLAKKYRLGATHSRSLGELLQYTASRVFGRKNGGAMATIPSDDINRIDPDGNFWALRDLSFDVQPGEVVGIIGRNGAGKSTLLKILSQIVSPTAGRIELHGRVASLLEVGTGFHPELTGRENVYLNGAILGMNKEEIRSKFGEIVDFSGINEFIDTPVKRYSSGMHVRLAFAVAAHLEPEILIIDEVLAVGDAEFQKRCIGKMEEVSKLGRTVVFVSHSMSTVRALCGRVILFESGSLVFDGHPDAAIERYAHTSQAPAEAAVSFEGRTYERHGPRHLSRLISLELIGSNGNQATVLPMGKKATFHLQFDMLKPHPDMEIGLAVMNREQSPVHYFISCWEGLKFGGEVGRHAVEIEIPAIHLFPGDYHVHVWTKPSGGWYDDAVHEALRFSVEDGRVNDHRTYFERYSRNSQVYVPSRWRTTRIGDVQVDRT